MLNNDSHYQSSLKAVSGETVVILARLLFHAAERFMGRPVGLIDGNPVQVINNPIGAPIAQGLAIAGTWIILKICGAATGGSRRCADRN